MRTVQLRPKCIVRRPIRTSIYTLITTTHFSIKRGVVKTLMHIVDTIVSDLRDKVEEKSQALNMNGRTSVLSDDKSDDGQDTVRDTTIRTPTGKKTPVILPYIKGV